MKRLQKAIYHPGSDNKPPRVEIYTTYGDIYDVVYCASYDADPEHIRSPWQCDCSDGVWGRPCWHIAAAIRILDNYYPYREPPEGAIYENGKWHNLKGEKTNGK